MFPDNACHRKILDLTVECSHSGCSWTGELRDVEVFSFDFFLNASEESQSTYCALNDSD